MANVSRLFAALVFAAIAVFLVVYTWLPSRNSLVREEAVVTNIAPRPNTWYEVELTTSSNHRITCRSRHGWPLVGPSRCPLDQFEGLRGKSVTVMHDGKRPYEVTAGEATIIDYSGHRRAQEVALLLAMLMLVMAALTWRRK